MLGRIKGIAQVAPRLRTRRPRVESLERRALLTTYTVTSTSDSGAGSLRAIITQVDSDTSGQTATIDFNLGNPASSSTIALQTALPAITRRVIINGPVQPTGAANPGAPALTIDGTNAAVNANGSGADGLVLTGPGGSTVSNLAIVGFNVGTNFGGRGIVAADGGGDTFTNNDLGIDTDGLTAQGNIGGIELQSANNVIGISSTAPTGTRGNLISGNLDDGILIDGAGATGNVVAGNLIGTDSTGQYGRNSAKVGTGNLHGIELAAANGNTIGGTTATSRNVISGNVGPTGTMGVGILFTGTSANDVVEGDLIGANAAGTGYIGNSYGISFGTAGAVDVTDQISNITIGGTAAGSANTISGNGTAIYGTLSDSVIEGNMIGANSAGTAAIGNGYGILLGGHNVIVGALTASGRNVIVGSGLLGSAVTLGSGSGAYTDPNFGTGVDLTGNSFLVEGNAIGLGLNQKALPNKFGILLNATNSIIGGTAPTAANFISGNTGNGITLLAQPGNQILGNLIGNPAGGSLGNGGNGIGVVLNSTDVAAGSSALVLNDAIGGLAAGSTNIIAGNGGNGVAVADNIGAYTGLTIRGNHIGGNGQLGISLGPTLGAPNPEPLAITSATSTATTSSIQGVIGGSPGQTYLIDLYGNTLVGTGGYGQGQTYLGTVQVTIGPGGLAGFSTNLATPTYATPFISAAASPVSSSGVVGSTSEFSTTFTGAKATADLALQQTVSANTVSVGGNVTLTATITNTGTTPAQDVVFTDALNADLVNAIVTTSVGQAGLAAGNVATADLGNLASGASATVTIVVGTSASTTIQNVAGVLSTTTESNYANNFAAQSLVVNPVPQATADLAITITPGTTAPVVGGAVTYVLTATNNGPNAASNVQVNDFLPTLFGLQTVAVSQGGPYTINGTLVGANLGTLAAGGSATMTLTGVPFNTGAYTDAANVASNLLDPTTGNNTVSSTLTVGAAVTTSSVTAASTGTGTTGTAAVAQGPTVAGVAGSRSNGQLVVTFSEPITAATATTKANYLLYALGSTPRALTASDRPIVITSLHQTAATNSVTLTPSRSLAANQYYTLVVVGSTARGITDTSGRKLAGAAGGAAGTDSTTTFLAGSLVQV